MYGRNKANKNRCSQKSLTLFVKPYLLLVKNSESCICSIQFYAEFKDLCYQYYISPLKFEIRVENQFIWWISTQNLEHRLR